MAVSKGINRACAYNIEVKLETCEVNKSRKVFL